MADRTLNIDTSSLASVASSLIEVANAVRQTYTEFYKTVETVTGNDSWKGAASDAFLNKFEAIRPEFERDLEALEKLGPTFNTIAGRYEETEEGNVTSMGGNI